MFQITVTDSTDLLGIRTARTASEMEDVVTALHKEFPGAHVDVRTFAQIQAEDDYLGRQETLADAAAWYDMDR
jgi:hypothetical protein